MLRRYFIYGNLGIFMEVFWTGMQSFIKKGGYLFNGYNICYYVLYLWSCGVYGAFV